MKRYMLFGVLSCLLVLMAVMSSMVGSARGAQAKVQEPSPVSPAPAAPVADHMADNITKRPMIKPRNPTRADLEAYKQATKEMDLKWERKLYLEAKKRGMKFEQDGGQFAVPTDTYLMGDWAHKRKPGEDGIKKPYVDSNSPELPDALKEKS